MNGRREREETRRKKSESRFAIATCSHVGRQSGAVQKSALLLVSSDYFLGFFTVPWEQEVSQRTSGRGERRKAGKRTSVLRPRHCSSSNTAQIQRTSDNLVSIGEDGSAALKRQRGGERALLCAGKVLSSPSAHENDRVLLQIVTLAGNVGDDGSPCAQLNLCDLANGGIGFLWLDRVDLAADALLLVGSLEGRSTGLPPYGLACAPRDLVEGCREGR